MSLSSVLAWNEFLRRYYWEDVLKLAGEYPEKRSLFVQFSDIEKFDFELATELLEHPDVVMKHMNEALVAIDLPVDVEFKKTHIRIAGCPEKIRRRDIRQDNVDRLIMLDGIVQRATEVTPRIVLAAFKCQRCGHVTFVPQAEGMFIEPFECESDVCGRKGPFKLLFDQSGKVDAQVIRLQELTEDMKSGEKSQTIDVSLDDDIAGLVAPGNRVSIVGILRAYQRHTKMGKSPFLDLCLDAIHIEVRDGGQLIITLTQEDIRKLKEMALQPNVVDRIVESFVPTVHGMQAIKEGMLCAAVSNGHKLRGDGTPQRDFSHVLICSDPGMAKSNLKMGLKKIVPRLVLSSGTGSTKAGLTAAAVKDGFAGGTWSVEAGVLALADGGGVGLDEFDKFNKAEIKNLNDALSQCQFEIDKVGFHLKLWARCFVVAFMNPKEGRFDQYTPLPEQVDIPPDTLSRFDLIFTLYDLIDEKNDLDVATKIAQAWTGLPKVAEKVAEKINSEIIPVETLQKYISYAQALRPVPSEEVVQAMIRQYVFTRQRSKEGRVAITSRYKESLLRLSKAEAQLSLSQTIEMHHLRRAINLLEASIAQVGTDEHGQLDADIIATGQSKSQRDKVKLLTFLITDIQENNRGIAPIGEIILAAQENGLAADDVKIMFEKLKKNGDLIEVSEGKFMVV